MCSGFHSPTGKLTTLAGPRTGSRIQHPEGILTEQNTDFGKTLQQPTQKGEGGGGHTDTQTLQYQGESKSSKDFATLQSM